MPLKDKRPRHYKYAHETGQSKTFNSPKRKDIYLRSKKRSKKALDYVSECMKCGKNFLKYL